MKTKLNYFFNVLALLALLTINHQPSTAFAQGTAFTYQGRLNSGSAPATGTYNLTFSLYATDTSGVPVAGPVTNNVVGVTNGLFTTLIDFGSGVFTGATNWLQIGVATNGVSSFTTLTPRQELTPAPYAIYAENVSAAGISGTLQPASLGGAYGNALTLSNAGNSFAGSGAGLSGVNAAALNGLAATNFWQTAGNVGTSPANGNFVGTTDNQPLELRINGERALRLEPTATNGSINFIGGSLANFVAPGAVGSVIAGGGGLGNSGGTGTNGIYASYALIGGGGGNKINAGADYSAVVSGQGSLVDVNSADSAILGGAGNWIGANTPSSVIAGGLDNSMLISGGGSADFIGGGEFNGINDTNGLPITDAVVSGGNGNQAQGSADTIGGGQGNLASNSYSTVGGGIDNVASGLSSTVAGGGQGAGLAIAGAKPAVGGGGAGNTASGDYSFIGGGRRNTASGFVATIAGGDGNTASLDDAFIGGGWGNVAQNVDATISGGDNNTASGPASVIAGGEHNTASGDHASIGGGYGNNATNAYTTIGGGTNNAAGNPYSVVGGGQNNAAAGNNSAVAGGAGNTASGANTAVAGGFGNSAGGDNSFVGGGSGNNAVGAGDMLAGGFNNSSAGGNNSTISGGNNNNSSGSDAVIGGGQQNSVSAFYATIGGGVNNTATNNSSTVAGGTNNVSGGYAATVPGGSDNLALGDYSFAAGHFAQATNNRSFVWSDGSTNTVSTTTNQFVARAANGFVFYSSAGVAGVSLAPGSGSWSTMSDRNAKDGFASVNPETILARVASLPMTTWSYRTEPGVRHVGPMAQDFHAAFCVGENDTTISTVDEGGVALAAIQGLNQKLEDEAKARDAEIQQLKQNVAQLQALVAQLAKNPAK